MVVRELEEVFNSLDHQEAQKVQHAFPEEDYAVLKRENRFAGTLKKGHLHMYGKGGFTLVELMVVAAIMAILAVVATPAYINYVNRTKQGEAASMLFTARLEMEEFYTDNGWYASTIQCLPSFAGGKAACLANCSNCANSATVGHYTFHVSQNIAGSSVAQAYYQIAATRQIYSWASADMLTISAATDTPVVQNTNALKFSVFQWIFQ
jgi:type IV pilus assembly protein PilE